MQKPEAYDLLAQEDDMRHLATALAPVLLLSACVTTSTTTRTWGDPYGGGAWERPGHVESVQETVTRTEGNPAGGAVAGAVIGGLLGSALGGHTHYDRWGNGYRSGSGVGALVGAVGGAAVGAAASQGGTEDRYYDVVVRFDDGGAQRYLYRGYSPFQPGEPVVLTPQGLSRR
jgi:outer membrane lipoprotein SlyB